MVELRSVLSLTALGHLTCEDIFVPGLLERNAARDGRVLIGIVRMHGRRPRLVKQFLAKFSS
jgi:hypothetical protein